MSRFSALQRAEIAEMYARSSATMSDPSFSALQRAEIAEIRYEPGGESNVQWVSVLFNEPKLLKYSAKPWRAAPTGFSALQRAEIAEIVLRRCRCCVTNNVSVLFNEPKLLKS